MKHLFFATFLLLQVTLGASELRLAAESESTLTVAGCVNVMNGDFFQVDSDIVVDGPQPLSYTRFYDSGDHSSDFFFYRVSLKNKLDEELSSIQIDHLDHRNYNVSGSNGLSVSYQKQLLEGKIFNGKKKK